jgi:hypothetical protein
MEIGEVEKVKNEFQTIKVWRKTYKSLKLIAALTGETMVILFQRLTSDELSRVKSKEINDATVGE